MQTPHPPQAGGRRKVTALGQRLVGQAGIGLQLTQQAPVHGIKHRMGIIRFRHGNKNS